MQARCRFLPSCQDSRLSCHSHVNMTTPCKLHVSLHACSPSVTSVLGRARTEDFHSASGHNSTNGDSPAGKRGGWTYVPDSGLLLSRRLSNWKPVQAVQHSWRHANAKHGSISWEKSRPLLRTAMLFSGEGTKACEQHARASRTGYQQKFVPQPQSLNDTHACTSAVDNDLACSPAAQLCEPQLLCNLYLSYW